MDNFSCIVFESVKTMLKQISTSNKYCSFEPSIHQRILKKVSLFPQNYYAAQLFSTLIVIRFCKFLKQQIRTLD